MLVVQSFPLFKFTKAQYFFLAIGGSFLALIVASVIASSLDRKSIIGASSVFGEQTRVESGLGLKALDSSTLALQNFHRIEVKNGVKLWEIKAGEANFLVGEDVTHVNDSSLVFFRDDGSVVNVSSKSARLYREENGISKAEIEGEVNIKMNDRLEIVTDLAVYAADSREIYMPGKVDIFGEKYLVKGEDLRVRIDSQLLRINKRVMSRFVKGAKVPSANIR